MFSALTVVMRALFLSGVKIEKATVAYTNSFSRVYNATLAVGEEGKKKQQQQQKEKTKNKTKNNTYFASMT